MAEEINTDMEALLQTMYTMNEAVNDDLVEELLAVVNKRIASDGTVNGLTLIASAAHFIANSCAHGVVQGMPADEAEAMADLASDYIAFTTPILITKLTTGEDPDVVN